MKSRFVLTVMAAGLLSGVSAIASAHGMDAKDGHGDGQHMQCHDHGDKGPGLSPEKEKFVHEAMHKVFAENKPLFEKMGNLHKELHGIMAADKFDAKAYLAKAAQLDALDDKIKKNMEHGIAAAASHLSPQERKAFMEKMMMHKGHGGSGDHHDHGGPWDHHGHDDHGPGDRGGWQQHDGHGDHGPVHDDDGGSPRHDDQN